MKLNNYINYSPSVHSVLMHIPLLFTIYSHPLGSWHFSLALLWKRRKPQGEDAQALCLSWVTVPAGKTAPSLP